MTQWSKVKPPSYNSECTTTLAFSLQLIWKKVAVDTRAPQVIMAVALGSLKLWVSKNY